MPFLHIGYKRIHYTDVKPQDGQARETFIFLHGLGSSQNYYSASIETLAEDVVGILDALNVKKAVFVGHSMGGIVGAHVAAERSDRIVAAVLIGPIYPNPELAPRFLERIKIVTKDGMQPMADTIPRAAVGKKASPLAKAMIRELLLAQDAAGYISNCRVILNAQPPSYSKIGVPVLILAGDEDTSAPLEWCKKMFDEIKSSEKKLEVMKGVGHWHCVEAFDEVARLIEGFYREIQ